MVDCSTPAPVAFVVEQHVLLHAQYASLVLPILLQLNEHLLQNV